MKKKVKAYLAGIVDAEGSIYVGKQPQQHSNSWRYSLVFSIANDSKPLMKWLVRNVGGIYRRRNICGDVSYEWISKKQKHTSFVLDLVLPYLLAKRSQALLAKRFISLGRVIAPREREAIFQQLRQLKSLECVTTNTSSGFFSSTTRQAYFAGLLDGEGYVRVIRYERKPPRNVAYYVKVQVTNSEKKLLHLGKANFGGSVYPVKKIRLEEKQRYSWEITNNPMREKFLLAVLPYLRVKREQSLVGLQFLRLPKYQQRVQERERLYHSSEKLMRESKLNGDVESEPLVTAVS